MYGTYAVYRIRYRRACHADVTIYFIRSLSGLCRATLESRLSPHVQPRTYICSPGTGRQAPNQQVRFWCVWPVPVPTSHAAASAVAHPMVVGRRGPWRGRVRAPIQRLPSASPVRCSQPNRKAPTSGELANSGSAMSSSIIFCSSLHRALTTASARARLPVCLPLSTSSRRAHPSTASLWAAPPG